MSLRSITETLSASPSFSQWEKIGIHHHHGIDIPLFALVSRLSSGIGEFPDLLPVVDWLYDIGMDVLQLLPLNDSGDDPSPYNALSAFALHPIYLGLENLPYVAEDRQLRVIIDELQSMNHYPKVSYHEVLHLKNNFLRIYHLKYFQNFQNLADYRVFIEKHRSWIKIYALFKVLKEYFDHLAWFDWPKEFKNTHDSSKMQQHFQDFAPQIQYYEFVQYLCFRQFCAVKKHSEKKKVFLKGDIPILISPDSADVWYYPDFFDMTFSAGAPPDMFNPEGQYWGFPTYQWNRLRRQNFIWWRERLQAAENLYHMYRIDHVIGFYRIWQIPRGGSAKEGHFVPRNEKRAIIQGEEILHMMLNASSMLPIAEDLGIITDAIRASLKKLGIAGTRVMRWERTQKGQDIVPISHYDPINLTTLSTHDSETLQLWWQQRRNEAKDFAKQKKWRYTPNLCHAKRFDLLKDSHDSATLFHINLLQEYFGLYPELSWPNPEDERINIPGFLLPTNWTYRFRPTIEEFTSHAKLLKSMKELIAS